MQFKRGSITEQALPFFKSRIKANNIIGIIAMSEDKKEALSQLKRRRYKLKYREGMYERYKAYLNNPSMTGINMVPADYTYRYPNGIPAPAGPVVTSFDITLPTLQLLQGYTYKVAISNVQPDGASTAHAQYASSDSNIVYIDFSGNITAKAVGSATITVSAGSATKTLDVTVSNSNLMYKMDGTNEFITIPSATVASGKTIGFKVITSGTAPATEQVLLASPQGNLPSVPFNITLTPSGTITYEGVHSLYLDGKLINSGDNFPYDTHAHTIGIIPKAGVEVGTIGADIAGSKNFKGIIYGLNIGGLKYPIHDGWATNPLISSSVTSKDGTAHNFKETGWVDTTPTHILGLSGNSILQLSTGNNLKLRG